MANVSEIKQFWTEKLSEYYAEVDKLLESEPRTAAQTDLEVYRNEFVPNSQGFNKLSYSSWKTSNPGEAASYEAYRDSVLAGNPLSPPALATKFGKMLVAAGKMVAASAPTPDPDPDPTPDPTPSGYRWNAPTLSNPTARSLGAVPTGSGGDLHINGGQISGNVGEIKGYNDILMENFKVIGGSTNSQGTIIPRENTGTFYAKNGRVELRTNADAFTCRWRQPKLYIVNTYIEVTKAGTTMHSDGFQTQEAEIDELGFDCCTIKTDYQGIFTSNEPNSRPGGRSKVGKTILSRVLFLQGAQGQPATYYFKAFPPRPGTDPIGPCEFYDVWMPALNAGYKVYPSAGFGAWDGSVQRYGCFVEQKQHKNGKTYGFVRFSKSTDTVPTGAAKGQACGDCQIGGDGGIWLYNTLADVPSDVGSKNV